MARSTLPIPGAGVGGAGVIRAHYGCRDLRPARGEVNVKQPPILLDAHPPVAVVQLLQVDRRAIGDDLMERPVVIPADVYRHVHMSRHRPINPAFPPSLAAGYSPNGRLRISHVVGHGLGRCEGCGKIGAEAYLGELPDPA